MTKRSYHLVMDEDVAECLFSYIEKHYSGSRYGTIKTTIQAAILSYIGANEKVHTQSYTKDRIASKLNDLIFFIKERTGLEKSLTEKELKKAIRLCFKRARDPRTVKNWIQCAIDYKRIMRNRKNPRLFHILGLCEIEGCTKDAHFLNQDSKQVCADHRFSEVEES